MHFMMDLQEDFEPSRASLLSRSLTPSLGAAVKELISKENCRPTYHMSSSNHMLATLSLRKVLAASFVVPRAMISLFVANCRNSCKSRIKLLFLEQLLCVPQIYRFLQVHLRLPHLLQLISRQ